MTKPLKLAVVGHTNVGKTSLLRTLTRDVSFGKVSPRASTTRHVEGARLSVDGTALLELFDTPGMEDAISLLDYLERTNPSHERLDGPAQLERFLAGSEAAQRYEQEAKVLRQLLASDAGLYVIDVREPVLSKYRDELAVLSMCGQPLLPVLNFVASPHSEEAQWRQALARLGLHAQVAFDSVAPTEDGEQRLYTSLALLLERARPQLQRLLDDLNSQRQQRRQAGYRLIADLLLDVAAYRRSVAADAPIEQAAINDLHQQIRQREQRCVEALLRLYAFRKNDAEATELPLQEGRWGEDLFNPETLKQLGIQVGGGMAAGAATGIGIDLMVGGITLGAAAVLGAIVGGTAQTLRNYGSRLLGKLKGQRELTVHDSILRLLALRQQQLLLALEARGHAATSPLQLAPLTQEQWQNGKLPDSLNKARAHPEWSQLNPGYRDDGERQQALHELLSQLP